MGRESLSGSSVSLGQTEPSRFPTLSSNFIPEAEVEPMGDTGSHWNHSSQSPPWCSLPRGAKGGLGQKLRRWDPQLVQATRPYV